MYIDRKPDRVTVDEITFRIFQGMFLATALGLTVQTTKLNPRWLMADFLAIAACGFASLGVGSQANKLSAARRDMEMIQQQALKDAAYKRLTSAANSARPVQTYTIEQLEQGAIAIPPQPFEEVLNPVELMLENIKHGLISAPTRSGKSLLLNAYIAGLYAKHGAGNFDLLIVDPKKSTWLGLEMLQGEKQIVRYLAKNDIAETVRIVEEVCSILNDRIDEAQQLLRQGKRVPDYRPFYFIFDEYSDSYGHISKNDKAAEKTLMSSIGTLASKGAGLQVFLTIVGQTSNCNELGFSAQSRDNFGFMLLGSPKGSYSAINKALSTDNVVSKTESAELKTQWKDFCETKGKVFCFMTNMGGEWIFGESPNLAAFESMRLVPPTPNSGLLAGFSGSGSQAEVDQIPTDQALAQLTEGNRLTPALRAESVNFRPTSAQLPERISLILGKKGIKNPESLHRLFCQAIGTPKKSGEVWNKTALIEDFLKLKGRNFELGKELWDYLESQFGAIQ